jgi:Tfp pilus assembly protein PilZ
MYKLLKHPVTNENHAVQKQVGNMLISIPFDPANTDYQAYLKWLDEGGVVLPADEPNS